MAVAKTSQIASFLLYMMCQTPAWAQPSFLLNGSATELATHCYQLTAQGQDIGSMWSEVPLNFEDALDLRFMVNLGCAPQKSSGMAFVMQAHPEGTQFLGCQHGAFGFGNTMKCKAPTPSLAVELDSYYDRYVDVLRQPHLALVRDGKISQPLLEPVPMRGDGRKVNDCEYHQLRITWKPSEQVLRIYFDEELRLSYSGNILYDIFEGRKDVSFGFTAISGSKSTMQAVCVQSVMMQIDEQFNAKRNFEEAVHIYPNPAREKLTIDMDFEEEEQVQMQLYNDAGKLIYEIPTHQVRENTYSFNMPGLPSGVYYITVTNGTDRVSRKVVHVSILRA